jgi:hypothetical protein
MATALTLRSYNQERHPGDPAAPFSFSAGLVGIYLSVAVVLTVALDTVPGLATFAPVLFPGLSLAGMAVLAIRADHARRLVVVGALRATEQAEAQAEATRKEAERAEHNAERRTRYAERKHLVGTLAEIVNDEGLRVYARNG